MLIHPENPELFVVDPADVLAEVPPTVIRDSIAPLRRIVDWAEHYLCHAHPELGREGPVCPYVQASMRKCTFYMTVQRGRDYTQDDVERIIMDLRDWFLALEPTAGSNRIYKTILCLFPDFEKADVPSLIDQVQDRLKTDYVPHGVMVGEFHDGPPDKAGLWNPDFRPLAAPVPMLVVRHMVATDFAFLQDDPHFVRHYIDLFGTEVPAHLRQDVADAAKRFGYFFPDPRDLPHVHRRVRSALEAHKVEATVYRHQDLDRAINSPRDFAEAVGASLDQVTKSLFLRSPQHRYVVLLAPINERVDLNAVAHELGYSRLELADLEELAAYLDYSPGGVSPIGVDSDIPVHIDTSLLAQPTVFVAAGEVGVEIEVRPAQLQRMTGAQVHPLTTVSRKTAEIAVG